jgi:iron complex outermembrane recepter protein
MHQTVLRLVIGGLCAMSSLAPLQAQAQAHNPETQITFNIPSQTFEAALLELAKQASLQLAISADTLPRGDAPRISGKMPIREALGRLLRGTELTYEFVGERTLTIMSRQQAGSASPVSAPGVHGAARSETFQIAQSDAQTESPRSGGAAAIASSDDMGRSLIEEITVTAQKREERLKDVPISISVLRGDDVDKSTGQGLTDLLSRVPGISNTVNIQGGQSQLSVRGVTASAPLFSGSGPIGYYLDSVPFGLVTSSVVPDTNPYDLNRVEVLRGPQGTLYGASALNGVVRVLTQDADLDSLELKGRTSGSHTDGGGTNYRGDMAVNVPILEGKLAARAVVGYQHMEGWVDSPVAEDVNESNNHTYRLKVNAEPTERLALGLSAWRSESHSEGPSAADDNGHIRALTEQPADDDFDTYGLELNYEFDVGSLASRSGYLKYSSLGTLWIAPGDSLATTAFNSRVYSEEITFNSKPDTSWRWSFGAFYRDGRDNYEQFYRVPIDDHTQTTKSAAVFGEIGRRFYNDRLEWTLGFRDFRDRVSQIDGTTRLGTNTFHATTPRAVLTWHPNSEVTVYGSYSQGFRSGFPQNGLTIAVAPDFPPVKPDKLTNYEVGAKADWWERKVSIDASVYYIDWQDIQQTLLVPFGGLQIFAPINTNSASGIGADFALTLRPASGLELMANASWNDLALDSPVISAGGVLFEKGQRPNLSAEWTAGFSGDYTFPLGSSGFAGRVSAAANYTSRLGAAVLGAPPSTGESILIARAGISLDAPEHWTATLFVDNLNNEDGIVIRQFAVDDWSARTRPRTVGLQVEVHF